MQTRYSSRITGNKEKDEDGDACQTHQSTTRGGDNLVRQDDLLCGGRFECDLMSTVCRVTVYRATAYRVTAYRDEHGGGLLR